MQVTTYIIISISLFVHSTYKNTYYTLSAAIKQYISELLWSINKDLHHN